MGFPNSVALPDIESLAVRLVGSAISPYQAALILAFLQQALVDHTGLGIAQKFSDVVRLIDQQVQEFHVLQPVTVHGVHFLCEPAVIAETQVSEGQDRCTAVLASA